MARSCGSSVSSARRWQASNGRRKPAPTIRPISPQTRQIATPPLRAVVAANSQQFRHWGQASFMASAPSLEGVGEDDEAPMQLGDGGGRKLDFLYQGVGPEQRGSLRRRERLSLD